MRATPALLAAALALPAEAQAPAEVVTCTPSATCDAAGACAPGGEAASFRLVPREVNEFGAGAYRLERGDVAVDAVMRPDMSLIWAEGEGDLQMLTLLDGARAIWVRRSVRGAGGPPATIAFVTCAESG